MIEEFNVMSTDQIVRFLMREFGHETYIELADQLGVKIQSLSQYRLKDAENINTRIITLLIRHFMAELEKKQRRVI